MGNKELLERLERAAAGFEGLGSYGLGIFKPFEEMLREAAAALSAAEAEQTAVGWRNPAPDASPSRESPGYSIHTIAAGGRPFPTLSPDVVEEVKAVLATAADRLEIAMRSAGEEAAVIGGAMAPLRALLAKLEGR